MLDFKRIELEDREKINNMLSEYKCPSLEYNFATLFLWQEQYKTEFAISDGVLFVRSREGEKSYLFPCGSGDVDAAADMLLEKGVRFHSLSEEQKEYIEKKFPGKFEFSERRDMEDYVYTSESLMNLTGKKLSAKRNHINKFINENPDWTYEAITKDNLDEVRKMHKEWCELADIESRDGLEEETEVVKKAFDCFEDLELSGGLIRSHGEVIAFSVGDRLNSETFLVHIEKAYTDINGAYQIINREFVRNNCAEYKFVNREEDTGDEGLRRAKLSYRPVEIVKKYSARERS